jgi:hypothetical protein
MEIWEEERRSCSGREKKRNVIICFDFRDSSILIWGLFTGGFID